MSDLLITNASYFLPSSKLDVSLWGQIYKIIPQNVGLVDRNRTGFKIPFRMTCPSYLEIPKDLDGFNKTFEQCCLERATEIVTLAERKGVKVGVFYSGGVDSTGTLVSFLRVIPKAELQERLIVFMNNESIMENPNLYYGFLRENVTMISSERFGEFLDKSIIITNGEGADQLFGTDMMIPYTKKFGFNAMFEPFNEERVNQFFDMFYIPRKDSSRWYDILQHEVSQAPIALESMLLAFWWFNFNFKWNSCFYRLMLRANENNRQFMDEEFATVFNQPFYMSLDFQRWAMRNTDKKIGGSWQTYKQIIKDFIFDYTKDEEWWKYKSKVGSLRNLFLVKFLPPALDSSFHYVLSLNPEEYYVKENSFQ